MFDKGQRYFELLAEAWVGDQRVAAEMPELPNCN